MEKIMFAEITALSNKDGFCSASNRYFSELYEANEATVSRWIANLAKAKYLTVVLVRDDRKAIIGRHIFTTPIDEKVNRVLTKKSIPSRQKSQYPIDEKVTVNNTSINTTSINREDAPAKIEKMNWRDVANAMLAHTLNGGKDDWEFLKASTGYSGDGRDIFANWAGKANDYQLRNWKDEFRKLGTWMKNEARADIKAQRFAPQQPAQETHPIARNFHRAKR